MKSTKENLVEDPMPPLALIPPKLSSDLRTVWLAAYVVSILAGRVAVDAARDASLAYSAFGRDFRDGT